MPTPDDTARREGTLTQWDDDRGFGFVTPAGGGARVFVHVSAFPRGGRPRQGCAVTYVTERDDRGRPRATRVQYSRARRTPNRTGGRSPARIARSRDTGAALAAAVAFFGMLGGLVLLDALPLALLGADAMFSVAAFVLYRSDKAAATQGRWRTPEATLHTVALLGGWPGALVARPLYRHKTLRQPFRTIFWCTVVVNVAALAWIVQAESLQLP